MSDEYVCPNGHPFPAWLAIGCETEGCFASVTCEPTAHGMALQREVERLRGKVDDGLAAAERATDLAERLHAEVEQLRAVAEVQTGALRRSRRWLLAAQAQATGGRRSTIEAHVRAVDDALRKAT